jgi:hypothetical protein
MSVHIEQQRRELAKSLAPNSSAKQHYESGAQGIEPQDQCFDLAVPAILVEQFLRSLLCRAFT